MNAATIRLLELFSYSHLPAHLQPVSKAIGDVAMQMATQLESDDLRVVDEVLVGLRRLLEAKDCFVRAALVKPPAAVFPEEVRHANDDSGRSDYL